MASYESIIILIKAIIVGIAVLGFIVFVLRPLMKNLAAGIESDKSPPGSPRDKRFVNEEIEIPTTVSDQVTNESIIKMAKKDTLKTTILVRNWLREKK